MNRAPPLALRTAAFAFPALGSVQALSATIVLCLAALVALASPELRADLRRVGRAPWLLLAAAIVLWGALSAFWSIDPARSVEKAAAAGGLLFAAAVLATAASRRVEGLAAPLALGFACGAAYVALQLATGGAPLRLIEELRGSEAPITLARFNRPVVILLLVGWAAAFALRRRFGAAALAAPAAAALLAFASDGYSNKLAAAAGLAAAAAAAPRALAVAAAAWILALPALAATVLDPARLGFVAEIRYSGFHRLMIWEFASRRIFERPLLGWGLEAARDVPGAHDPLPGGAQSLPLHPHSAAMHAWLDLGAIGAALLAALVVALLWRIPALVPDRLGRAALTGGAAAGLTVFFLSFGLWQAWWLATLGLAALLFAALAAAEPQAASFAQSASNRRAAASMP